MNCTEEGWNEFELITPFEYNGTDNLVLAIDDNSNNYDGYSYVFYYSEATSNVQIYIEDDDDNPNPSSPSSGTRVTYYPNTIFCFESPNACSRPTDIIVDNITGNSAELSWTGEAENHNIEYISITTAFSDNINTSTLSSDYTNDSDYPWTTVTNNPHSGSCCMASGNRHTDESTSSISLTATLEGDGTIEFYSRISSEDGYDYGFFYIDGVVQYSESGTVSWMIPSLMKNRTCASPAKVV